MDSNFKSGLISNKILKIGFGTSLNFSNPAEYNVTDAGNKMYKGKNILFGGNCLSTT